MNDELQQPYRVYRYVLLFNYAVQLSNRMKNYFFRNIYLEVALKMVNYKYLEN